MGDVVVLFIAMIVIGAAAFAPLGYFIFKFSGRNTKPFHEAQHGGVAHPSIVNDFAEKVIAFFGNKFSKGKS